MGLGDRHSTGLGYVIISSDNDRQSFINYCLQSGTITMLLDDGGIVENVKVSKEIFNYIVWPETKEQHGSVVLYIKNPLTNELAVVGIISESNDVVLVGEYQSGLARKTQEGVCEVIVDGKKLFTLILAHSNTDKGGDVYILSKSKGTNNIIKLYSTGDIKLVSKNILLSSSDTIELKITNTADSSKECVIKYVLGEGLTIQDEFDNKIVTKDGVIEFNDGSNGGLTNTPVLRTELNKLVARITALEAAIAAFAGAQSSAAGAVPILAPLIPGYGALGAAIGALPPQGSFTNNIENSKIQH